MAAALGRVSLDGRPEVPAADARRRPARPGRDRRQRARHPGPARRVGRPDRQGGAGRRATATTRHLAWQVTGDATHLETLYTDQIEAASAARVHQHVGQRVDRPRGHEPRGTAARAPRRRRARAQRLRARPRGQLVVRGRRATTSASPSSCPTRRRRTVRVVAYNMGATPVLAKMTAWDVEPGTWSLTQATGPNPDALPGRERRATTRRARALGRHSRSRSRRATYTVLELTLATKGVPYWTRPDLGIGARDVVVSGRTVTATVHSLGAVATPRGPARRGRSLRQGTRPCDRFPRCRRQPTCVARTAVVKVTMPAAASTRRRQRQDRAGGRRVRDHAREQHRAPGRYGRRRRARDAGLGDAGGPAEVARRSDAARSDAAHAVRHRRLDGEEPRRGRGLGRSPRAVLRRGAHPGAQLGDGRTQHAFVHRRRAAGPACSRR